MKVIRLLQRLRQRLAGSYAEKLVQRAGLGRIGVRLYEYVVLRRGRHHAVIRGMELNFVVSSRVEITAIDMLANGEGPLLARLVGAIRSGDVFYDVGANIGVLTLVVASASSSADLAVQILAFEPEAVNAAAARRNIIANAQCRVTLHELALGRYSGQGVLYTSKHAGAGTHSMLSHHSSSDGNVGIAVMRGDDFVRQGNVAPTVVKIDVEGAEMDVLLGMEGLIAREVVRELFVEVHPKSLGATGLDEAQLVSWLAQRGYRSAWRYERGEEIQHQFQRETDRVSN